ncbi:hypothetical protein ACFQWB_15475 [Paenibacillus thermoaerophilus]|uniref:Uncharacterized protein n=1 Tax=Paenibacillus thermoaerophilus TaxID=1215385 RepID=A0ABW2V5A4_9BACL|nr:hypothetical protein [Paenibacillus thermoaerophilus]TMV17874.1 hypothetical protein FE781_05320 [Paenibacillus thermoaerophilus]
MRGTKRKISWTVAIVTVLGIAIAWLYGEGRVTMEDIITKEFQENRELFAAVAETVAARDDITGIAGPSYRGNDERLAKLFDDLGYLTVEKRQGGAVLFVKDKKLGFDHGILYVPPGKPLPKASYATRTPIDDSWSFVSIKTD